MKPKQLLVAALCGASMLADAARGQTNAAASGPGAEGNREGGQSLGQAAEDPTASLMSVQISDWYTARFHGLDDEDANSVVLRSAIPFKTGDLNHILRATIPFITDSPFLDSGLSDITLFDLMVFNQSWGRWGIGPVALFPTGAATVVRSNGPSAPPLDSRRKRESSSGVPLTRTCSPMPVTTTGPP